MNSFSNDQPSSNAFYNLYQTTGWNDEGTYSEEQLFRAIRNSWHILCVYNDNQQLIGFARLLSDGVYQTFLCDLIIHPSCQHMGIGSEIVRRLIDHCRSQGMHWIQLSSTIGKQSFYERFGFKRRPDEGPGMQLFL